MLLEKAVAAYDYSALESSPRFEITTEQVKELVTELSSYHELYQKYFTDERQARYSYSYLSGLLDPEIERKSAENIALATRDSEAVRPMQYFLGTSRWSDDAIIARHRTEIGLNLGQADGILIIDGSDIPKQGKESVGVKRQHCGELGKIANCQAGVFLGYSSKKGYSLLDKRLYLPKEWLSDEYAGKRYKCHVPADISFQTKNELAWEMIEATAQAETLPARWITMDEAFGNDSKLLTRIDRETDYYYFAEIAKITRFG